MPMKVELVQRDARSAPKAPEHEKLKKVAERSQVCGEFLEWLRQEKDVRLVTVHRHTEVCYGGDGALECGLSAGAYEPYNMYIQALLAEFFEIDQEKLEAEKVALLEWVRAGETGKVR